jgi:rhodanese-related sulfurtransferase
MTVKRVSPEEAKQMIDGEGYVYVAVRSLPEFEAGHPADAYNVPLMHQGPGGMTPNPEFMGVMEQSFSKTAKLVVGCKAGGRSARAAALLEAAGFTSVVDQKAGYEGPSSLEPGWRPKGLPTSTQAAADHTYEGLRARKP